MSSCGDGFVQNGVEACDDGNGINTDGCLNNCVAATCGDGYVQVGAGAYICGEETGLIESLEGKRPYPRIKPPYFPAVLGLYNCPTIVNNAETMAQVKHVLAFGGAEFAKIGIPGDSGTHIWGVSGLVKRPGLYEIEAGKATFGELLYDLCGGPLAGVIVPEEPPGARAVGGPLWASGAPGVEVLVDQGRGLVTVAPVHGDRGGEAPLHQFALPRPQRGGEAGRRSSPGDEPRHLAGERVPGAGGAPPGDGEAGRGLS